MASTIATNSSKEHQQLAQTWDEINQDLINLKVHLPANSLDQLITDLGGPEYVSEMTGRKSHIVCSEYKTNESEASESMSDESDKENFQKATTSATFVRKTSTKRKYKFEKRSANGQKTMNIDEKNLFLNGEKMIAVFNRVSCYS